MNNCPEVGPPYFVDMSAMLVRFRTHPIISTDIEKAFLHVRLSEADREMTRFLCDCLEVGLPYFADMGAILVRFRTHPIGIPTNIEKAFLHVRLSEADRDMTRFLWLSDPTDPESDFKTYRFRSVLFGSASSPFMLNAVLQTHLDNHKTPVTQDMKENLYVDNVITG